jgi:hypothetical protein
MKIDSEFCSNSLFTIDLLIGVGNSIPVCGLFVRNGSEISSAHLPFFFSGKCTICYDVCTTSRLSP